MKNVYQLIVITLFILVSMDQAYSQVRLGAKAGLNMAKVNYDEVFETETKFLPTFMVGGVVEFDFSESLSLGTGLQYHGKGAKSKEEDDVKVTLGYIQVPLQLQFRSNGFFGAVGPYAAFAISGKSIDGDDEEDIEFGSGEEDDWSALDVGVNAEIGYEFNKLRLTASYSAGLSNGIPKDQQDFFEDAKITNAVIGIALTYLFTGVE